MPSSPPETPRSDRLSDVLVGASLTRIEKLSFSWIFHFGNAVHLSVEGPWRIVSASRILLTSEDDGQQFGLPQPIDAIVNIRQILENHRVTAVDVDLPSSDLRLQFDNDTVLQILNSSSGFECWVLDRDDGLIMVGRNGSC